jgi:molybdopterin/thiamine biosynthesis adenylyltransferase
LIVGDNLNDATGISIQCSCDRMGAWMGGNLNRFVRNIGLLTREQQRSLASAHVAVCGVGGMGGVAAEALARMGVGTLSIADYDRFELSNMNRQLQCTEEAIGRLKVDVVAERLFSINPKINLHCFKKVEQANVKAILKEASLVINGMDDIVASLSVERVARKLGKTIIDSWVTPFASVFVMLAESPHWEDFLDFPTRGKEISDITQEDVQNCLRKEIRFSLAQFDPFTYVSVKEVDAILTGKMPRPSLVPVVWISGILMANEAMKILTHQGTLASHWGVFYNQYDHELRVYQPNGSLRERVSNLKTAG